MLCLNFFFPVPNLKTVVGLEDSSKFAQRCVYFNLFFLLLSSCFLLLFWRVSSSAVVAALVCRHAFGKVCGFKYPQYFAEQKADGCGTNPCLVVVAPFVLKDTSHEDFYWTFFYLNPLCPYILLMSISELLSLYYEGLDEEKRQGCECLLFFSKLQTVLWLSLVIVACALLRLSGFGMTKWFKSGSRRRFFHIQWQIQKMREIPHVPSLQRFSRLWLPFGAKQRKLWREPSLAKFWLLDWRLNPLRARLKNASIVPSKDQKTIGKT